MKQLIKIILVLMPLISISQSTWHFNTGFAIGYNSYDISLWKYKVENHPSIGAFINVGYEYSLNEHFSGRIMAGFHQYHAKATINDIEVSGYNYNFEVPIEFRYTFYKNWTIGTGISLQDYRDRDDLAMLNSYNLRANFIFTTEYHFHKNWTVNFKYSRMISEKIDAFIVQHYTTHFFLGVSYIIGYRANSFNEETVIK